MVRYADLLPILVPGGCWAREVGVALGSSCPSCRAHLAVSVPQAGKFSIIPTVINIGSGLALMGAVSTSLALLASWGKGGRAF